MTYIVSANLRMEPDDFWPSNRMQLVPPRKFHSLLAAKQYADKLIEKLKEAETIVEVSEKDGPAKYRVERDDTGTIRRTPLV